MENYKVNMILVTGASGKTGKAVIARLSKVEPVCAFVHRTDSVPVLESVGAEKVLVGDLRDAAAIRAALNGVRAIYHICPNMNPHELEIGSLVIEEARRAGVGHFVYHSVLHPQVEVMKHHWQKMRVEERLFESGVPYTVLQPAPYMQNILAGWKSIVEDSILRVPYSVHAKFSFIDLADLAEAATAVLVEEGHRHAIYEMAGTGPRSHVEAAEIFSKLLERDVRAEQEDLRDWKSRVRNLSGYAEENLVRMFEYYDQWGLPGNPNVLRWILKRDPTSLETFIEGCVKTYDADK